MTEIPRLPDRNDPEDLCSALDDYGCCVVEGAVGKGVVEAVANEMASFVEDTPRGTSDFAGAGTRRTGLVVGRSPTFRSHLARHPVILLPHGRLDLALESDIGARGARVFNP